MHLLGENRFFATDHFMALPRPQRIRLSCLLVGRAVLEHPPVGLFSVTGQKQRR